MGYSNVELANQALDHLGKDRIASLSENSTAARKINEVFERTIYAALSRSHWSFCRKIASLASVTNDWDERWAYKYDIPSDCLTVVRVIPRVDMPNAEVQEPHELMGGYLYTNAADAKIEYVYKSTSTLTMPEPFLTAVSMLMARDVCMPLTRKRSFWNDLNRAWEMQLATAVEHDAGQQPNIWTQKAGGYLDARGAGESGTEGGAPDGSIYWQ